MSSVKKEKKNKIIVILGPTASGKSDVAIKLAKKFDGEIISADSRQVYRGMDIGSGKVTRDFSGGKKQVANGKEDNIYISEGIAHYLIDVADPNEDFNVSHFKKLAKEAIEKILQKGKLPIICGGTGFWIKSIVDNAEFPKVKPNKTLREKLNKKTAEELFQMLAKLDSKRAESIDPKNKVRLIRAIEIAEKLGKVPDIGDKTPDTRYQFLQIGISVPREALNEKIKKRLDARFDEGMAREIENLYKAGVSWVRLESFGLEYRWISKYLQGKVSLDEMKQRLYYDIIHYAKRQMTWFKKDKRILWLKDYEEIEKAVALF
ncbi:MAG TPA: tRNA (adenosine(37)-N6)-dimethylallyltransferase MiaA [Candidatus Moranbacteria bacterium]|mgnify:CR=1 FL=1|jgi:tRNA dimethylallyltransferase|nr:tRNA (adenosine(37)-N6)-dimethylallyltransferase MiaA [Candidatus Moranbacteria bacterium]HOF42352.1 tRNA (adenosine(37)-N6)-dimethylallyltransferase MiaA [Candidatus Moranbacteria bacterium]HPX94480.1 tRNA (adenosine(37)-N6)-dimethylallyltransferase MiaA [Candidatus Moranbacteria bacterium]HQB59657.1 tRNA (adenosine(37)-N6)-dimethylallyltransferase MiaA [Candidatus Moranbacteria bacterium]